MAFARFNLYRLSYSSMFYKIFERRRARGGRWAVGLEFVGVVVFWCWFGGIVLRGCGSWKMALAYVLVSHAATSPLHVQAREIPALRFVPFSDKYCRLFYPILECPRKTLGQSNHSPVDNFAPQWTSSALSSGASSMEDCNYKSHIICFLVFLDTISRKQVLWSKSLPRRRT